MHAGLHEAGGDDRGRAADRARGVHAEQRLAAAPSASARYSSGIITPSNKSGALPTTTASMSSNVEPGVRQRPVDRLAHQAGHRDVAAAWRRYWVWPTPSTAAELLRHQLLPSRTHDQVLLQRRTAGRVRQHPAAPSRRRSCWRPRRCGSARRRTSGWPASAPPDGLTVRRRREPERLGAGSAPGG